MSSPIDRVIKIELTLRSSQPELLEGLDAWLRLGLLSEAQVRQLCREKLTCLLPQPVAATVPKVTASSGSLFPQESQDFATEPVKRKTNNFPSPTVPAGMLQSLMAELSVRWLLFLGVFMVVVSSGVLAASQWERFPAAGQYGVLLTYTLIFWAVSFWAGKQSNLHLTAQTLQIVTLLLVPVNFWAMDSFRLWQNPLDWLTVAIGTVALTYVTVLLLKNRTSASPQRLGQIERLSIANILGLSYLQWGWRLTGFSLFSNIPLIAVYLGTIGTCLIVFYQTRYRQQQLRSAGEIVDLNSPHHAATPPPLNWTASVVIYALVMLLVRAIFIVRIDVTQLGLALGICGWLVAWLAQQGNRGAREIANSSFPQHPRTSVPEFPWETVGGILILLGWLVSVGTTVPWQATAVSGLGLWFLSSRLTRFWLKADLTVLFVVGLQTIWLVWRLIPQPVRQQAIATCTQLVGAQGVPFILLSLALFPYVLVIVAIANWLYKREKLNLAYFGECLALLMGTALTLISLANPTARSLNFLLSTLTLGFVTQRRAPTRASLIYLTHIMGLLTLGSTIDRLLPNLSRPVWASIILAVMVVEWGFTILDMRSASIWQRSAWHIGLGLAGLSYSLLWIDASPFWVDNAFTYQNWAILWLITPLALTGVASQSSQPRTESAIWLSVVTLFMAQLLTLTFPGTRLIGLGVATGLMLVNTRYVRQLAGATIALGFGLSFIGWLLWDGVPQLSAQGWFIVGASAILSLWLARSWLRSLQGTLAAIYARATDGWAVVLCSFELLALTLHSYGVYHRFVDSRVEYLIAALAILAAIAYRSWRQPTNWAFYGLGWGLEVLTAEALGLADRSVVNLAIANIALGLMTQLLGEAWRRLHRVETLPSSCHILPILYGVLGGLLRWGTFTSWTGLCSLAISLIVIGVGRRRQEFKPLVYLGLIGISVSAYELLFYQLLHSSGGAFGDGLIAMSVLGTTIMYAYRVLSPWLIGYLGLTAEELKVVAHLHWAWSSCILLSAITAPIAANRLVGLGTGAVLIQYAIFQGRHQRSPRTAEIWVYLGLLEFLGIRTYWLYTAVDRLWSGPLVPWKAPIACLVGYFLYILPWERWGWPKKPWQRAAYIWPLLMLWETRYVIYPVGLLIAAGFYVFLARLAGQIRFTYISAALVNWALFRWFGELHLTDPLWYVIPIGLSLLYVAQVEPALQLPSQKVSRHYLRVFGSGLICVVAFIFHQDTGLQPWIASIVAIFLGLALRVRAFLYVGTAIFLVTGFYQLVVFIFRHPFFKWVVGLIVGIAFISIAANFETRREQLTSLVRNWIVELQEWN